MKKIVGRRRLSLLVLLLVAAAGCGTTDDRLVELSERSLTRQIGRASCRERVYVLV